MYTSSTPGGWLSKSPLQRSDQRAKIEAAKEERSKKLRELALKHQVDNFFKVIGDTCFNLHPFEKEVLI
jgi:hypothetical protein